MYLCFIEECSCRHLDYVLMVGCIQARREKQTVRLNVVEANLTEKLLRVSATFLTVKLNGACVSCGVCVIYSAHICMTFTLSFQSSAGV